MVPIAVVKRLSASESLTVGQEVGTLCHFVHGAITAVGVESLSLTAAG